MMCDPTHYPVDIPEGVSGEWEVKKVIVGNEMTNLRYAIEGFPEMVVSPGHYTTLTFQGEEGREVMMSNTQFEYRTNKDFVSRAHGDVLITGLGLGMILRPLAANPNVKTITVIEKSRDVLRLVQAEYADLEIEGRLRIFHGDAFKFKLPEGERFDIALHDIWPTTCTDNLTEMQALKHRYAPYVTEQFCWAEDICWRQARMFGALRKLAKKHKETHRGNTTGTNRSGV